MGELSTFLYARPSFTEGASRVFDFGNTLAEYNCSLSPDQADYIAIRSDWRLVGMDIEEAIRHVRANRLDPRQVANVQKKQESRRRPK